MLTNSDTKEVVTKDAYCTEEIRSRIVMSKSDFSKKRSLLTNKMSIELRKKSR